MDSVKAVGIDENQYRTEVLCLPSGETETSHEQQLADEAQKLGLKVPEIEATASLAASIASGAVDLSSSSPVLSSGSSTDRTSACEATRSRETSPVDQVASSLSDFTLSSDRVKPGSTRSLASLSTRPTSYSSNEGKPATNSLDSVTEKNQGSEGSVKSASPGSKKEKRRTSLKSAIARIYFRRKRAPSAVLLPPSSQVTVAKGGGETDKVYVEPKPEETIQKTDKEENEAVKLEVPFYDNESLQRSLDNSELSELREAHKQARNRHLAFQAAALNKLRHQHQAAVPEKLAENKRLEDEKREKNERQAAKMEERQLAVEMEQVREFERAKMNSRTRIKYMERYFDNSNPPPTPRPVSIASPDGSPPARSFTPQHKAQLEQEYHDHESMDQLHEAKIKVLRERQEVKLQEAIERMEMELEKLIEKHANDFSNMQKEHQQEEASLMQALDAKKTKLRHRWNLEEAILRKKLESKHGVPFGPLPPLTFTDLHYDTRDSAICVSETGGTPS